MIIVSDGKFTDMIAASKICQKLIVEVHTFIFILFSFVFIRIIILFLLIIYYYQHHVTIKAITGNKNNLNLHALVSPNCLYTVQEFSEMSAFKIRIYYFIYFFLPL